MSFTRLSDREIVDYEQRPPIFRVRPSRTSIEVVVPRYVFTEFGDRYREAGGVYSPRTSTFTFPLDAEEEVEAINREIVALHGVIQREDAGLSQVDLFVPFDTPARQAPSEGLRVRDIEYVQEEPLPTPEELVPTLLPSLLPPPLIEEVEESPIYSPERKESSESLWEYSRRIALYRGLLEIGLSDGAADLLSRMRNQVDLYGVGYSQNVMEILNSYLPLE